MATSDSEIDALFRLPLNEFTAARNALAAKLKKAGRADDSAQVKGLAKPPVSAWAVNQLYWKHRDLFERLLAAGDRLRSAQASQLRGKGGEASSSAGSGPSWASAHSLPRLQAVLSVRAGRRVSHYEYRNRCSRFLRRRQAAAVVANANGTGTDCHDVPPPSGGGAGDGV